MPNTLPDLTCGLTNTPACRTLAPCALPWSTWTALSATSRGPWSPSLLPRDQVVKKKYIFQTDNTSPAVQRVRVADPGPRSQTPARYHVPIFNATFDT